MKKNLGFSGRKEPVHASDICISVALFLLALIILFPFYNAVMISLVPVHVYVRNPASLWPQEIMLDAYEFVLGYNSIWSGMRVTGFVTLVGTIYNMLLTVTAAYAFSKAFPGKRIAQILMIIPMYFTGGMVPNYLLIRDVGLINSIWSMILPTGMSYTYMLIIMRYIQALPHELEEAAEIDGAGHIRKLFWVVLPMALPILATYTLYYAVERWNEWKSGMLYIRTVSLQPMQLILRNLIQDGSVASMDAQASGYEQTYPESLKMASIVVTMVPIMVLYPFLQRYFLSGLTQGAVKG